LSEGNTFDHERKEEERGEERKKSKLCEWGWENLHQRTVDRKTTIKHEGGQRGKEEKGNNKQFVTEREDFSFPERSLFVSIRKGA